MAEKRDYYEILGVSRSASESDIKGAYRKLCKEYHPDVAENKAQAEKRFKDINEAYEVLINPEKRSVYDRFGHSGLKGAGFGEGDFGFGGFGGTIFEDVFDAFFGRAAQGGAGRRGHTRPTRGSDLQLDLEITLEEAFSGLEREIEIPIVLACDACKGSGARPGTSPETCAACHGTGEVRHVQNTFIGQIVQSGPCVRCGGKGQVITSPCQACGGEGRAAKNRKLTTKIPAGVDNLSRIRLQGEGEAGLRGGPRGDLFVRIRVRPHPIFQREKNDIFCDIPISFPQAALGAEISVPTLEGKTRLKIPPGTQSGATFRLKEKGMPNLRGYARGDQVVTVIVRVPVRLTDRQKKILQEFVLAGGDQVEPEGKGFFDKLRDAFGG